MADNQVEEVKSKIDIATIIGERIDLKKAGRNYKASCPFHGEKTASFMVSPELQIFKCFGCSEGGDVFTFLEKFEGMEFSEALKYLAERTGVKLANKNFGEDSEKEKLLLINKETLKFYNYMLLTHPFGKKPLEYLIKERGLDKKTIEEFQIGFSPENSLILKKFLVDKKKFYAGDIEKAGIAILRGGGFYDRFSGRVTFPLFDHRGNPVGFSGRVLPWGRSDTAKYINSPETLLYHKSKILFGLNITRTNIKNKKVAIVVEGELDAISSYQAGIKNVVAIKGSALTEDQVRLLSRFAEKFILALDSDMAGDAAARRGIAVAENIGIEVKVAKISRFKDPDEAAKGDIESYKNDLIKAKGIWDFMIDSVFERNDASTGIGKAKISKEITPIVSGIENKIVQAHYAGIVAQKMGVPLSAVMGEIEKTGVTTPAPVVLEVPDQSKKDRSQMLEDRFLSLALVSNPQKLKEVGPKFFGSVFNKKLVTELDLYLNSVNKFDLSAFAKSLPPELFTGFTNLVLDLENSSESPDDLKKELDLVSKELKILMIKKELKALAAEMRDMENLGEKEKLLKAQNKFTKLTKTLSGYEEEEVGGIILNETD